MIFKIALGIILIYLFYRLVRTWKRVSGSPKADLPATGEDLVEDPLCHTYVPVTHAHRVEIDGKAVYFCSKKCLERYTADTKQR